MTQQSLFRQLDTLEEVVAFATNPENRIDGVLIPYGHKDDKACLGKTLCTALKAENFSGPIALYANIHDKNKLALLSREAKQYGALGVYSSHKTPAATSLSALSNLNEAVLGTNRQYVGWFK